MCTHIPCLFTLQLACKYFAPHIWLLEDDLDHTELYLCSVSAIHAPNMPAYTPKKAVSSSRVVSEFFDFFFCQKVRAALFLVQGSFCTQYNT